MELNTLVGERIKQLLLKGKFDTIEAFAWTSRIPKSTLSEILNGKNDPKVSTLAKIAGALEISVSELLNDAGIDLWAKKEAKKKSTR